MDVETVKTLAQLESEIIVKTLAKLESEVAAFQYKQEELEKQCRHFNRQFQALIDHVCQTDELVQNHEWELFKQLGRPPESKIQCEERLKKGFDELDEDIRGQ
jgi:hypothetical protein